ncbi:hypothetical protein EMIHUDRAFT_252086 [Emiliania huxleyi CCMP1516]|uniref:SGNH hydrolase-type esterase domain-containing protein n=2 Tax=Emiliania huxleyi TaxID=2903 RepID=A0A0D3KNW3_EMIH1|nr:hypothetical protein EMIHUDRAFT_252086 [Emiliania huxleyi CCMP1516]EOD37448.1 hypothetical protein EMIHUDRAFT_252086 [Emiliania huxleyi CCMP1516]|eukprot:XP_005789877.1 hypothetical protein EMIHUDRAFT_252086 [Emiliania huxleyi CCMP1516]
MFIRLGQPSDSTPQYTPSGSGADFQQPLLVNHIAQSNTPTPSTAPSREGSSGLLSFQAAILADNRTRVTAHFHGRRVVWDSSLAPWMHARALGYLGTLQHMSRLIERLSKGEPIKVVALGGSVTHGHGLRRMPRDFKGSWSRVVFDWIAQTWPNAKHTYINGAVPATGIEFFSHCLSHQSPADVDLIMLEFSVNSQPNERSNIVHLELLTRRIHAMRPHNPAAIVTVHYFGCWTGTERCKELSWLASPQRNFDLVAQYYDFPSVSMRNALDVEQQSRDHDRTTHFGLSNFSKDHNHPNNLGHQMMGDVVIYLLLLAAARLDEHDSALPPWPPSLPIAMVQENQGELEFMCSFGQQLAPYITANSGFEFVEFDPAQTNRQSKKPGYLSLTSGSSIDISMRADLVHKSLTLNYLKSYDVRMGRGVLTCHGGCSCRPHKLGAMFDGKDPLRMSIMWAHTIILDSTKPTSPQQTQASRKGNCTIRIVTSPTETDQAGAQQQTKFKLLGMIVNRPASRALFENGIRGLWTSDGFL